MGRMEKELAGGLVKYVWYPGDLKDWRRAGIAIGAGLLSAIALGGLSRSMTIAVTVGTTVTAAIAAFAYGQKDAKGVTGFQGYRSPESGRAAWRALVKGFGLALAAVLIARTAPDQGLAGWILPVVPVLVAAVAHHLGMVKVPLDEARAKAEKERKEALRAQGVQAAKAARRAQTKTMVTGTTAAA